MKKNVYGRKLSRSSSTRRGLFRALVRAFVLSGEIKTTYAKAKFFLPDLEKIINIAKQGDVSGRRRIYAMLGNDREVTDRIFEIAKSLSSKTGGYIKTVNLPARRGDAAPMVKLSWTEKIAISEKQKAESLKDKAKIKENKKVRTKNKGQTTKIKK